MPLGQQITSAQALTQITTTGARFILSASGMPDCSPDWIGNAGRDAIPNHPEAALFTRQDGVTAAGHSDRGNAAVILTSSGTTGVPKTVLLSQAMILAFLNVLADTNLFPPVPGLIGGNIGFDILIADMWLPWVFGCHAVILDTERRTPATLARAHALGARMVSMTPSQAVAMLDEDEDCFRGFDGLHVVGEALSLTVARRIETSASGAVLVNGYGPSELAVLSNAWRIETDGEARIPLGRSLPGYRVLVADEMLRPLPAHWPGELIIASAAPALGYHDAGMTRAGFVEIPGEAPGPFFRSGDFGWIDAQGRTQFIGRRDRQLKIFGVRVELNGIEYRVGEVEGVADAGVVPISRSGRTQIVAVVQPVSGAEDFGVLRTRIMEHCRTWLARAAIPSELYFVADMPKGPSGKKSYRAIQDLVTRTSLAASDVRGRTGTLPEPGSIEAKLAAMWADELGSAGLQPCALYLEDDVFTLGATSLDATVMAERIERTFGIAYPDDQMFLWPTIAGQAAFIRNAPQLPSVAPAPAVVRRRVEFRLVRAANDGAPSRGAVLGLPGFRGRCQPQRPGRLSHVGRIRRLDLRSRHR